jgi:methionyl-tRNA formyltransferase
VRVLYWGTPDFAVPPLRALIGEGFDVCGVVTQPDKAVGRSRSKLEAPPVKHVALEEQIPVLQPDRPRGDEFVAQIRELAPDISVVVAYGHILPTTVIDAPKMGTINVHASLLPRLRGAAPIQAAILEGHAETGVTIMRLVKALDAGPMILRVSTPIPDDETYGELQLRLAEMGAMALIEALALMSMGHASETPQDDALATYAPKVDRTRTRIDWAADARSVARAIRAFDPKPGAFSQAKSGEVKLFGGRVSDRSTDGAAPGEIVAIEPDGMSVACGSGAVLVASVHPAGKRRIAPEEWARGRGIAVGERLF